MKQRKKNLKLTREEWLHLMALHLVELFELKGFKFKRRFRVSCGLPSKGAFNTKGRVIGECWASSASKDGVNEIFISPTQANSLEVTAVLAHELVHAWDNCKHGHKGPFRKCALAIGLEGQMRSTTASKALKTYIKAGMDTMGIGKYPHKNLDYTPIKKQTTRLIKVVCQSEMCDYFFENLSPYTARLSRKCLYYGVPSCGSCGSEMDVELKDED